MYVINFTVDLIYQPFILPESSGFYDTIIKLMEGMGLTSPPIMTENSTLETGTRNTILQETESYMTFKVARYIAYYWFPVLIPLGLVGNTLSFLVMVKKNNRKISTCIYMAAVSVNDSLLLCFGLHDWLVGALKISQWGQWECKIAAYLDNLTLQCATYQVLAMTFDKYVAIKWPHRSAIHSTPRRAKWITLTIIISVIIYNLPHLYTTAVVAGACYGYSVKSILTKVFSWFTIVINAVIPFTLLIYMNYVIVKTVKDSRKIFRNTVGSAGVATREKTMKTAENQLTTMLLLVTTLFLILLLPTYIRFIYAAFVTSDTPSKFATSMLISEISYKLYVTNSGINFFLYCVSGKKFRNDLKEIVCCIKRSSSSSTSEESNVHTNTSGIEFKVTVP